VVQQPGVSTVIPGARSPEQVRANAEAGSLPPLGEEFLAAVADLYDRRLRQSIHPRW
jgi:aryl-alcohol dehydrogenase-like predicted oxidoreductase